MLGCSPVLRQCGVETTLTAFHIKTGVICRGGFDGNRANRCGVRSEELQRESSCCMRLPRRQRSAASASAWLQPTFGGLDRTTSSFSSNYPDSLHIGAVTGSPVATRGGARPSSDGFPQGVSSRGLRIRKASLAHPECRMAPDRWLQHQASAVDLDRPSMTLDPRGQRTTPSSVGGAAPEERANADDAECAPRRTPVHQASGRTFRARERS